MTNANFEMDHFRRRAAFESTRAERDAIPEDEVAVVNFEIQTGVITTNGCLPKLAPYRETIVKELTNFPIRYFDNLGTYANAAGHAQTLYLIGTSPEDQIQKWTDELGETRATLSADVAALTKRGIINPDRVANLRGAKGIRNIALDVMLFCEVLREEWANVSQRTAATIDEISAAEQLADKALTAVGIREQSMPSATPESDARSRAFTLLVNAYDQVRRAMSYLRWNEGDVDSIIPSLYAGRGGGNRSSSSSDVAKAGSSNGAAPARTTPAAGSVTTNAHSTDASPAHAAPANAIAPGMPGSNPFAS